MKKRTFIYSKHFFGRLLRLTGESEMCWVGVQESIQMYSATQTHCLNWLKVVGLLYLSAHGKKKTFFLHPSLTIGTDEATS